MVRRIHLCLVAGDDIWQVTLSSSVMGFPLTAILGFNLLQLFSRITHYPIVLATPHEKEDFCTTEVCCVGSALL